MTMIRVLVLGVTGLLLLAGCVRLPVEETRSLMGTQVTITILAHDGRLSGELAYAAAESAFVEIERIEQLAYRRELKRLNNMAGYDPAPVGSELNDLIFHAFYLSELTGGAFRPDIGPLVRLWGFGTDSARVPLWWQIDRRIEIMDSTLFVQESDELARLDPVGASLELGGVAKGYAVDRACWVLEDLGVTSGMVWAGGDLKVIGQKPDGSRWRIAVRHPRDPAEYLTVLELDSGAVATSGDYERYFEEDGVRYHHILDPATGYPARKSISATVVHGSCMEADALATALFVLGPQEGIALMDRLDTPGMVVGDDEEVYRTSSFARLEADEVP